MIKQQKFRAILKEEAKNSGKYKETVIEFTFEDLLRHKFVFSYPEHWIFLRSTGLFDKNGREIFEGDIIDVKFNHPYVSRVDWHGEPDARAIVFWDFAGFRLKCKGTDDQRYADWTDTDGYFDPILDMSRSHSEVIGDIYRNPNLK